MTVFFAQRLLIWWKIRFNHPGNTEKTGAASAAIWFTWMSGSGRFMCLFERVNLYFLSYSKSPVKLSSLLCDCFLLPNVFHLRLIVDPLPVCLSGVFLSSCARLSFLILESSRVSYLSWVSSCMILLPRIARLLDSLISWCWPIFWLNGFDYQLSIVSPHSAETQSSRVCTW